MLKKTQKQFISPSRLNCEICLQNRLHKIFAQIGSWIKYLMVYEKHGKKLISQYVWQGGGLHPIAGASKHFMSCV